jgi:hypothetical protein
MQAGEGVVITAHALSPHLFWPSRWLFHWPLDLSVVSSDPVCSHELPLNQTGKSYPLSKEIRHKEIQVEKDVYCFMPTLPPHRDSVSVVVSLVDKLNRDDQQLIFFTLEK